MTLSLVAGDAVLEVDPSLGGRWTGLRVAELSLLAVTDIPGAYAPTLSGCFPMAPYAGRTGHAHLDWRGRRHPLAPTAPPHAIHGTVLDVPWNVVAQAHDRVVLDVALQPPWPWAGTVRQELVLSPDRLTVSLELRAAQEMPVVLGLHPWFRRQLARGGEAELVLKGGRQYVRGRDGLPTGQTTDPRPPPWDDCFTGFSSPPAVRWPGALEVQWTSSASHWVLYDEQPHAIAVEPQTGPPDAVRLGESTVVPAGGELRLEAQLAWSLV